MTEFLYFLWIKIIFPLFVLFFHAVSAWAVTIFQRFFFRFKKDPVFHFHSFAGRTA